MCGKEQLTHLINEGKSSELNLLGGIFDATLN